MSKSTDISLKQVTTSRERIAYRTPIKFGGRVVVDVVLFHVDAVVETMGEAYPELESRLYMVPAR